MIDRPLSVAAYVRVSTDLQAEHGYSIGEQIDRIKAYCAAREWNLVKIYTDPGFSGKDLNRPAIQQLITECKRYDIVLVNKLDRLSRSQKDTLYLIEDVFMRNGVQFASMTENFDTTTPLGMAMVGILSTFAQLERSQIKERMMTGQQGRAKKGLFHGSDKVPIGYKYIHGHLIVDEEEADMVREVYNIFLSGMSIRQISRHMKERYPDSQTEWTWNTVSRMLQNQTYIGKTIYRDMIFNGDHQAIIDDDTFERAQASYSLLDHSNPQWRNPSHKILSGFIWCGECGTRYGIAYSHSVANGRRYCYEYYQCYARRYKDENGNACKNKNYRMESLDELIKQKILSLNFDDIKEEKKKATDHSKEIARLEKQKNRLIDLYAIDGIDLEHLKDKISAIDKKILPLVTQPEAEIGMRKDEAKKLISTAKEVFDAGDNDSIRQLVRSLIKRITLYRDHIDIEWNF